MIGPFPYTVTVNAGVTDARRPGLRRGGVLHDAPVDHAGQHRQDDRHDRHRRPAIEVDKTGDITHGLAPQNVTYTFRVYNRTDAGAGRSTTSR